MGRAVAAPGSGDVVSGVLPAEGVISFARGIPSPDLLPVAQLEECAGAAIRGNGRVALNYGPPAGYGPLREWIGERHNVDPLRVVVTPGSMLGLNMLIAELVSTAGRVVVEAPTYDRMLHGLAEQGAEAVPVPRGADGLDLVALEEAVGSRPAFLYVLPTFHNPTGTTLSLEQRHALVDLAVSLELRVVEDDPYGLVRFEGEPLPTLHALFRERGASELCIFTSSFSKSVAPGLRVGYLILPDDLVSRLEARALKIYVSPPMLPQAQLLEFLLHGYLDPHLALLSARLCERRDALSAALAAELPADAHWTRPAGGYFLWLDFPSPIEAEELEHAARGSGVAFEPGARFFVGSGGTASARLAFSYTSPDEIAEGCRRLGALVRDRLRSVKP